MSPNQVEAAELLREIVERAVDDAATMIEFERVPEGFEITTIVGASGDGIARSFRQGGVWQNALLAAAV
jgi:hypothetical protein